MSKPKSPEFIPMPTSRQFWLAKRGIVENPTQSIEEVQVTNDIKKAESIIAKIIDKTPVGDHKCGSKLVYRYIPVSELHLPTLKLNTLINRLEQKGWTVSLNGQTG